MAWRPSHETDCFNQHGTRCRQPRIHLYATTFELWSQKLLVTCFNAPIRRKNIRANIYELCVEYLKNDYRVCKWFKRKIDLVNSVVDDRFGFLSLWFTFCVSRYTAFNFPAIRYKTKIIYRAKHDNILGMLSLWWTKNNHKVMIIAYGIFEPYRARYKSRHL